MYSVWLSEDFFSVGIKMDKPLATLDCQGFIVLKIS
jgi:hypothetical protein